MRARPVAAALAAAALVLAAGCGSAARSGSGPRHNLAGESPPRGAALLATSLSTAAATWAVAVMGGSASSHNNFWQLFERPSGSSRWKLVTPPGVADNGGLVLAGTGSRSVITAFRPSQYLTYAPLAFTRDGGAAWAEAGPLDGALADSPDALAASPGTGRLLALLTAGAAETSVPGYTRWTTLVTRRTLAKTAACAAAWAPSPQRRSPPPGSRCWPAAAACPGSPGSSPSGAGPGRQPDRLCPPAWQASGSRYSG